MSTAGGRRRPRPIAHSLYTSAGPHCLLAILVLISYCPSELFLPHYSLSALISVDPTYPALETSEAVKPHGLYDNPWSQVRRASSPRSEVTPPSAVGPRPHFLGSSILKGSLKTSVFKFFFFAFSSLLLLKYVDASCVLNPPEEPARLSALAHALSSYRQTP